MKDWGYYKPTQTANYTFSDETCMVCGRCLYTSLCTLYNCSYVLDDLVLDDDY